MIWIDFNDDKFMIRKIDLIWFLHDFFDTISVVHVPDNAARHKLSGKNMHGACNCELPRRAINVAP